MSLGSRPAQARYASSTKGRISPRAAASFPAKQASTIKAGVCLGMPAVEAKSGSAVGEYFCRGRLLGVGQPTADLEGCPKRDRPQYCVG